MNANLISASTLRNNLSSHGFLELSDFFTDDQFITFKHLIATSTHHSSFALGLHSYYIIPIPETLQTLLESPAFCSLVTSITQKHTPFQPTLLCFKTGSYTLLQDTSLHSFTGILDFSDAWKERYGGFISFVYNNKEILRRIPKRNSLFLTSLPEHTRFFVKYVNALAKDKEACFLFF